MQLAALMSCRPEKGSLSLSQLLWSLNGLQKSASLKLARVEAGNPPHDVLLAGTLME